MESAALSLLASFVTPIIMKLGSMTFAYFGGDITQKEIDKLNCIHIPTILTVIQAAESMISTTNLTPLKPWLMRLNNAAYEAEDLLDMYEYKTIRNKVSPLPTSHSKFIGKSQHFFSPILLMTAMKKSFEKIQQSADEAKQLIDLLQLVKTSTQPESIMRQQSTTVSGLSSTVYGRDDERDDLLRLLVNKTDKFTRSRMECVPIYAIYGIGGSGKTTLAQYIYNDKKVEAYFDERIWIEVTHNFSIEKITREILESIKKSAPSPGQTLNMLQEHLKEILKSRKFMLVLDNVWCENKELWDQLLIPLNAVAKIGSWILITTRSEEVGKSLGVDYNVPLKELQYDDCWSILMDCTTENSETIIQNSEFANIGKQIIKKLRRSPLATRIVGSMLRKKVHIEAWKRILKQDMLKETKDVLLFSFRHLPKHLQRCFAFCSLYPKGYEFGDTDVLVRLWISEGFVEPSFRNELTLEEEGQRYFEDLVNSSFFQKHPYDTYKIHDLLHDLAEDVSKDYYYRIDEDVNLSNISTIVHLSISANRMPDLSKMVNLRTLIIFPIRYLYDNDMSMKTNQIFEKLTKLRVLHYEWPLRIGKLSSSIGKLKHLRYLEASGVEKLPNSFGKLYHLRYFNSVQQRLDEVPKSFGNLMNLRLLPSFCSEDKLLKMPYIANLSSLQSLKALNTEEHGIIQLKNLNQLRGSLSIKNLQNVKSRLEAAGAMLGNKIYLSKVVLEWSNDPSNKVGASECQEVLEGLEPHPNILEFVIKCYRGFKVPNWMLNKQEWLPNLHHMKLLSCCHLIEVPHLPHHLQKLHIVDCPELMRLSPFTCNITELTIIDCPKIEDQLFPLLPRLTSISILYMSGFHHLQILPDLSPCMKSLTVKDFPGLTSMGNLHSLRYLDMLRVEKCPKLTIGVEGNVTGRLLRLTRLEVDEPKLLLVLFQEHGLKSLLELRISNCLQHYFTAEQNYMFEQLTSLKELYFEDLDSLVFFPVNIDKLVNLERLCIWRCPKIESLPNLPASLQYLYIKSCPTLAAKYKKDDQFCRKINHRWIM